MTIGSYEQVSALACTYVFCMYILILTNLHQCVIQNPLSEGTDRINWGKNLTIMIIISIMMNLLDLILLDTILIHKI